MKIVFMGTPDYATEILKEIFTCKDFEVVLLITQPDKPVGRKQILTPPHTKKWCIENNIDIPIYQPATLKTDEAKEYIASCKADFIVVAAYGQILPKQILDIAPCINLHASLLPKYRGASPIQSSILHNDTYTGVTSMLMAEGLDTGDILGFSYLRLDEHIKVDALFQKLSLMAAKLTIKTLKNFQNILPIIQKDVATSYAKKITKNDGLISFEDENAQEIYTKFRSYDPWPGIFLASGMKLKEISVSQLISDKPAGTIVNTKEKISVTCKSGVLDITLLQPPSKNVLKATDYIRGQRLEVGNTLV
jgi:methionyl-tRNA formyltransferase